MADVKKRKIRKTDWEEIGQFIKKEYDKRKSDQFRQDHEEIWREVDRQLAMKPMNIIPKGANKEEYAWRNVLELGEIAKVSEIIAADVMRITFPRERRWFETHCEIQNPNPGDQKLCDGVVRSLMSQQHADFGFQERVKLSVKEALHHGSFVAEIKWDSEMMVQEGAKLAKVAAPVWIPHSMWNCYPDPSPSILGTSMFYTGSMIIESFMPKYKLKKMSGPGWMPKQFEDIKDSEHEVKGRQTKDLRILTYYGDLVIERGDGDIYLPNSKVMTANDVVVFYAPNELSYPSVIYGGYEKQDPRDPYYTSPVIKMSPHQKMGSKLASRFLDAIDLKVEPPIVYDGNDPQFVMDGGPTIAPGAKSPTKGAAEYKPVEIGDPMAALKGLEFVLSAMQEGTGVSSVRSGAVSSDRATATEIQKVEQGGEVRTVEFIRQLTFNLRSFLYMQHELNKMKMESYAFYNDDMETPDFMRLAKGELPDNAQFEVVGAKGILGEEQRINRTTAVTGFAAGNPLFAPLLNAPALLLEMYRDAGQKNPERFLNQNGPQIPPEVQMQMQQMQQALQQMQAELMQEKQKTAVRMGEIQVKAQAQQFDQALQAQEFDFKRQMAVAEHQHEMHKAELDHQTDIEKLALNAAVQKEKLNAQSRQERSST